MNRKKRTIGLKYLSLTLPVFVLLMTTSSVQADHHVVNVVVKVESLVPENGVYFSPVWVGFHDGSYDLFDLGSLASLGVERIAEDGANVNLTEDMDAATGGTGVTGVITSPGGFDKLPLFDPGETSMAEFTLNPLYNRYFTYAAMVVPSNDAFIGNHNPWAVELFDAAGNFKGKKIITIIGSQVWDAGTELNTEMDAAFINQTAPNTGVTTMSPILPHPGFLGSYGNPGSNPIILGGMNAAGKISDPAGADFTLPYAVIARITIQLASDTDEMMAMSVNSASTGRTIQLASKPEELPGRGNGNLGTVYVTSQGLYYDTFVSADSLPYKGRFQYLMPIEGQPSETEFGPGDPGYLGGRWWIDANGNGEMDPPGEGGDVYLLCPLLPPGRETP
jgi:hypothetical protein